MRLAQLSHGGRNRVRRRRPGSTRARPLRLRRRRPPQVATWQGRRVYAFTRAGDEAAQAFAKSLGTVWAGGSDEVPPEPLDAAIIFAPVGALVPMALKAVKKGGRVVCGGIHMSDIPSFPYRLLWEERQVLSVANLTRADALEFLALVPQAGVKTGVRIRGASNEKAGRDEFRPRPLEWILGQRSD
jgi:alcohol dehydrogenase, propanol-preferring